MAKKTLTYSAAIEEIEEILIDIESGSINIDSMSKKVSRVSELLNFCKSKLTETEQEIEKIFKQIED